MDKRLGNIEILGKEYPLNFSVRIAQDFNETLKAKASGGFSAERQNLRLLHLLLEDGAKFSRLVLGQETPEPPTLEALEVIFTPADNATISKAIVETIEAGGMRFVHAKPAKKNGAAGAEEKPPKA